MNMIDIYLDFSSLLGRIKDSDYSAVRLRCLDRAYELLQLRYPGQPRKENGQFTFGKKSVDNSGESGIIETGSENNLNYTYLGKLDLIPLEKEFGKIKTNDIIITDERIKHIKSHHPQDYYLFEQYHETIIKNPDLIIKDIKNEGTIFMVKHLEQTNLNLIIRLALVNDNDDLKNSVMTFYRIRNKNLNKIKKNNKCIDKNE